MTKSVSLNVIDQVRDNEVIKAMDDTAILQLLHRIESNAREHMIELQNHRAIVRDCEKIVGGLSKPSKMPGYAYALPASLCRVGSKLRKVPGSVCHGCYAADDVQWLIDAGRNPYLGRYKMSNVKSAAARRFASLTDPRWTGAMAALLIAKYKKKTGKKDRVFRWHDSGDVQGIRHMIMIIVVARLVPTIQFWIPSRELNTLRRVAVAIGVMMPGNLLIRASSAMVDVHPVKGFDHTSTVHKDRDPVKGKGNVICPAPKQNGECRDCRACWHPGIKNVSYAIH